MSTEEVTVYRHSDHKAISSPLALTGDHPRVATSLGSMYPTNTCYIVYTDVYTGDINAAIILPKWVYIKDRHGRYLAVRDGPVYATITFRQGDPDLNCAFEAIPTGSRYMFKARSGKCIMRYYSGWYSSDSGTTPSFQIITSTGNRVYLKDSYGPSLFMSDELNDKGAPVAHDYINESSQFEILQAAIKNEITDVKYDIPGGKVREAVPLIALSTSVRNDSDGDVNQTLSYAYEKWSVGTWNNTAGIEIGAKTTFKAGVPFVTSAEFEISVSASYSHEWGGEDGEKQTITSSTTVTVPPKKKARATIIVRNAQIDVGFTYTQEILWSNGQSEKFVKTGIYNNIDSWHVDVVLDNWEDV